MSVNHLVFSLDLLESRRMLAGSITVDVNNAGDVKITGSNSDETVLLYANDEGELTVDSTDSSINGMEVGQALTIEGFSGRNLKVNLKGGDDALQLSKQEFLRFENGTVNMGSGTDRVSSGSRFDGNLKIKMGSGDKSGLNDQFATLFGQVAGKFSFSGGSSNDHLIVSNTVHNGAFKANLGGGNDKVEFDAFFEMTAVMNDKVKINGGRGLDTATFDLLPSFEVAPEFKSFESNDFLE